MAIVSPYVLPTQVVEINCLGLEEYDSKWDDSSSDWGSIQGLPYSEVGNDLIRRIRGIEVVIDEVLAATKPIFDDADAISVVPPKSVSRHKGRVRHVSRALVYIDDYEDSGQE